MSDTLKAIGRFVVQAFVHAHGLLPAYKLVEYLSAGSRWVAAAEGEGQAEVKMPIPLGAGIELSIDLHLGRREASEPLVTACLAPGDMPSYGALAVGDVKIAPGPKAEAARVRASDRTPEFTEHVAVVPVDLTGALPDDPRTRAAAALHFLEEQLMPQLELNPDVRRAGIQRVVVYDRTARVAMWADLNSPVKTPPRVRLSLDADGALEVDVVEWPSPVSAVTQEIHAQRVTQKNQGPPFGPSSMDIAHEKVWGELSRPPSGAGGLPPQRENVPQQG